MTRQQTTNRHMIDKDLEAIIRAVENARNRLAAADCLQNEEQARTTLLKALGDAERIDVFLGDLRADLVSTARSMGASWSEVAEPAGVSKQAAQQRYSSKVA